MRGEERIMGLVLERNLQRLPEFNVMETQEELKTIQEDLSKALDQLNVAALAANQWGIDKRLFAIKTTDGVVCMCNPMFVKQEGIHTTIETDPCLSNRSFLVVRHDEVVIDYQTIFGTNEELKLDAEHGGDLVQQMVQLLDGIGIEDWGLEIFDDFYDASLEDQQEVIKYYLEHLQKQQAEIQSEIDEDEDAKKIQDAITFMTKAAAGEIEIEAPHRIMPKVGRKERRKLQRKGLLNLLVDPKTNRYRDLTTQSRMK